MIVKLYKIFPVSLIVILIVGIVSNLSSPLSVVMLSALIISTLIIWRNWRSLKRKTQNINSKSMNKIIISFLIMIFVIQIITLKYFQATVYHDPFRVLYQAELLSRGHNYWGSTTYFWRYPNNVSIAFIISLWMRFTNLFHLTSSSSIHLLALIFLDSFIVLSIFTVRKRYKRNIGILALMLFLLFSPFAYTYYLQVFYTDLPNMLFLLIVFNLVSSWEKMTAVKQILSGFLIIVLITLGQLLKPNLIILGIAVLIITIGFFIINKNVLKNILIPLILILLGLGLATPVKSAIQKSINFHQNAKYQLPTSHWIWMSYNLHGNGEYMQSDVQEMLDIPTKRQRINYLDKEGLPNRLKSLGPLGVLRRWTTKLGLLLNVNNIQKAYTGGFIQTPKFYTKIQYFMSIFGQFIIRLGFIILYGMSLLTAIRLTMQKKEEIDIIQAFSTVTIVGFMLFHTIFWEAGARYGQILIPLLFMINTGESYEIKKRIDWSRFEIAVPIAGLSAIMIMLFVPRPLIPHSPIVVSAQRSQLSKQYGDKAQKIPGNSKVSQIIKINHEVKEIAINSPSEDSNLKATLVNLRSKEIIKMKKDKSVIYLNGKIKPGKYRVIFEAKNKKKPFYFTSTSTKSYKLANYPIEINGEKNNYRSMIYQASYLH
ncbi:hypothetical protein [Companilactobacillus sp. DQM5]|uniref:hypothetical protein n=1 Tax=Companilactobacillus sp. DQM5 TaxID=3463359 RepID=UPI004058D26A